MNYEIIKKTCEKHGEFESKRKIVLGLTVDQSCPKCQEVEKEIKAKEEQDYLHQQKIYNIAIRVKKACLPKKYRNFKNFEFKENQKKIKDFDFKSNLIIYGGVGTGKTMIASYLALKAIHKHNFTVRYLYASEVAQKVKATWGTKESEAEVLNDLINCDILILDEIGRAEYNEYLFKVLDGRYENEKITILAGNVQPQNIKSIFGDAIVSRLQENLLFANFGNIDLRAKGIF